MATATLEMSLPVALSMFSDLVGKKVSGEEIEEYAIDSDTMVRGVFIANGEAPGAVYLLDLELAAALGAALVMMPAGLVKESVQDKAMFPGLVDNSFEVLNVMSRLVNRAGGIHYKIREQVLTGVALAPDAAAVVENHTQRIDLKLSVDGYGSGRLTIVIV